MPAGSKRRWPFPGRPWRSQGGLPGMTRGTHVPDLANWLDYLRIDLSEVGLPEEAMRAATETITIQRRTGPADPADYEVGLAVSLSNLADLMSEVGQAGDAPAATEEEISIRRRLAERTRRRTRRITPSRCYPQRSPFRRRPGR